MRSVIRSIVVVLLMVTVSHAAEPGEAQKNQFLRFTKDKSGSAKLEASVARYVNDKNQTVDLVAAVHVGDAAYYQALNERFKQYDAVLYEMVKPEGAPMPAPGEAPRSGVGGLQKLMTRALDLTYQLDEVDYSAANFVHADLDTETFLRRMDERGESLLSLMLKAMLDGMNRPQTGMNHPDVQLGALLFALQAPDRPTQLKHFLGQQFQNLDQQTASMEGTVLLTDRNDAAIAVLADTLKEGKKNIAIFYGAAHLRGMERDLVNKMNFKPTGEEWLTAWDIAVPLPVEAAIRPAATRPVATRPAAVK
ncbi:MAG TPA: hypothetical protein VGN72_05270 [Tepidisphaeraceae bacterium]|jgi:hypothetical protein|nr:hypothetical protein [Tepidisphaeraceae bacterium]